MGDSMKEVIKLIAELVNKLHDILMELSNIFGLNLTDKELHLWVIGLLGIVCFFFVHILFKAISQWSITAISFIYTFTVLVVVVFAIEIQQKITGRGQMEFADAVYGLYGFIIFFSIYLILSLLIKLLLLQIHKFKNKNKDNKPRTTRYQSY
jgi:Ca2+/Na+ antiporter